MQDLPSAILGDQRELARLPEASVSNPIHRHSPDSSRFQPDIVPDWRF
jgi:hypothetical protein